MLSEKSVYAIGLIKTDSYALEVFVLDRETGSLVSQSQIPSRITRGMRDVFVLSTRDTHAPALAWFEKPTGELHHLVLNSAALFSPKTLSTNITFARVHDVQLEKQGLFVAETKDSLPYVYGSYESGLVQEWDFDDSVRLLILLELVLIRFRLYRGARLRPRLADQPIEREIPTLLACFGLSVLEYDYLPSNHRLLTPIQARSSSYICGSRVRR